MISVCSPETWLEEAYATPDGMKNDINLLQMLAEEFFNIMYEAAYEPDLQKRLALLRKMDEYFVLADLDRLDPLYSTALLRYSFKAHQALLQWLPFRDRVINNLEQRGENVKSIMAGLLDTSWVDQSWVDK